MWHRLKKYAYKKNFKSLDEDALGKVFEHLHATLSPFFMGEAMYQKTLAVLKQYKVPVIAEENVYENLYKALSEVSHKKDNSVAEALEALYSANKSVAEYVQEEMLTEGRRLPLSRFYVMSSREEPLSLISHIDMLFAHAARPRVHIFEPNIAIMGRWFVGKVREHSSIVNDLEMFLRRGGISVHLQEMPSGFQKHFQAVRDVCVKWQKRYQKQSAPYVHELLDAVMGPFESGRAVCTNTVTECEFVAVLEKLKTIQDVVENVTSGELSEGDEILPGDQPFFCLFKFDAMVCEGKFVNLHGEKEGLSERLDAFLRYLYTKCLDCQDALNYADLKIWAPAFLPINLYNACQEILAENGCELSNEYEGLLKSWVAELKQNAAQSNAGEDLQFILRNFAEGNLTERKVSSISECFDEMLPYLREQDGLIEVSCAPENFDDGIVAKFSWEKGQAFRVE